MDDDSPKLDLGPRQPGDVLFVHGDFWECLMNREEFDPIYFLDFCAAIENAVLNERLVGVGIDDGQGRSSSLAASHVTTRALVSDGVLVVRDFKKTELLDEIAKSGAQLKPWGKAFAVEDLDFFERCLAFAMVVNPLLYFERHNALSIVPNCHTLPMYVANDRVRSEQAASRRLVLGLAERYADFRETLLATRAVLDGDDFVRIPHYCI
jgi:hypothetical protein